MRRTLLSLTPSRHMTVRKTLLVALFGALAAIAILVTANDLVSAQTYSGPKTITTGGTYTGNWESNDPKVPAVKVLTQKAVTIENCNIRSKGTLIDAGSSSNLTVKNCSGYALNPDVAGMYPGRFLRADDFKNIVVENNYMEGTSGIWLHRYTGSGSADNSLKIRYNKAKNIDGRKSDGAGGFRTGNTDNDFYRVQFLQLDNVREAPGVEIAWNEIINEPYKSRVEDVISIYRSAGRQADTLNIYDNYIQGAYPAQPTSQLFKGGGIMLGDSGGEDLSTVPAWVRAYNNQVVSSANHGLAISAGHDMHLYNNRMVSSGELPDGTRMYAPDAVGAYVWDYQGPHPATFYNDKATGNTAGWEQDDSSRSDYWFPGTDCADCSGNASIPGDITRAMEQQEYSDWQSKLSANAIKLGPQTTSTTPTTPTKGSGKPRR
jgi:hypothetical protein